MKYQKDAEFGNPLKNMKFMFVDMDGVVEDNASSCPIQSVIQANQQPSVIQTTSGNCSVAHQPTVLTKGNVILVTKPANNSVIKTPHLQTLQVLGPAVREKEDEKQHRRMPILTRKPGEEGGSSTIYTKVESDETGSDCDSNLDSELSSHSNHQYLANDSGALMSEGGSMGQTIVQYGGQEGQFYVPGELMVMQQEGGPALPPEEQVKKREMRLLKNREAARECRRKKKEYIKCLENRVAVLETQNKALIDELKSLKELYCLQKSD